MHIHLCTYTYINVPPYTPTDIRGHFAVIPLTTPTNFPFPGVTAATFYTLECYNSNMTKQERISEEAVEVLRAFAPGMSITSAIIEMGRRVKSDESWSEFETHVIKAVNEAGRRSVTPATEKPVKPVTAATKPVKSVTPATAFHTEVLNGTETKMGVEGVTRKWNEAKQLFEFVKDKV